MRLQPRNRWRALRLVTAWENVRRRALASWSAVAELEQRSGAGGDTAFASAARLAPFRVGSGAKCRSQSRVALRFPPHSTTPARGARAQRRAPDVWLPTVICRTHETGAATNPSPSLRSERGEGRVEELPNSMVPAQYLATALSIPSPSPVRTSLAFASMSPASLAIAMN